MLKLPASRGYEDVFKKTAPLKIVIPVDQQFASVFKTD